MRISPRWRENEQYTSIVTCPQALLFAMMRSLGVRGRMGDVIADVVLDIRRLAQSFGGRAMRGMTAGMNLRTSVFLRLRWRFAATALGIRLRALSGC
jgi:hypothetical protein